MRVNSISDKLYSLLGLAMRAGKLISGSMLCENAIRSGKAHMVIISDEASESTMDKFDSLTRNYNTELIVAGGKEILGNAIGKPSRTVLAVLDKNFKQLITDALNENDKSSTGVINDGKN